MTLDDMLNERDKLDIERQKAYKERLHEKFINDGWLVGFTDDQLKFLCDYFAMQGHEHFTLGRIG